MLDFEKAKEKALSALSRRRYTKKEITDKLKKCGADDEVSEKVVEWAVSYGFLNDEEYVKSYISDAVNIKKYGMRKIKFELLRKGIDKFVLEDVLFEMDPIDETDNIKNILEKRLKNKDDRKEADRVIRYLISRGFEFNDIKKCIAVYDGDGELGDDDFGE